MGGPELVGYAKWERSQKYYREADTVSNLNPQDPNTGETEYRGHKAPCPVAYGNPAKYCSCLPPDQAQTDGEIEPMTELEKMFPQLWAYLEKYRQSKTKEGARVAHDNLANYIVAAETESYERGKAEGRLEESKYFTNWLIARDRTPDAIELAEYAVNRGKALNQEHQ